MKNFKLLSVVAICLMAFALTSCNTGGDDGPTVPTKEQAYSMMAQFNGTHQCGILFPEDKSNNITKDSITTSIRINAKDSTYTISNFPVSLIAKYVKDDALAKAIQALPNQTLSGHLLAHMNSTVEKPLFGTVTENLNFQNDGKNYSLAFYAGYYLQCAWAGKGQDKQKKNCFLLNLTPGAIFNGNTQVSNALKTKTSAYGAIPYTITLRYDL